jgi:hypothetical protein
MASTYTVNTGIELIANGEQSGTWGTTTNVNLEIIDRLTNGVGAITLSGTTHTLTTTDGTLSDGQFKVLVFGGSPSGTNTVTISPNDQDKQYFILNSSGQSVVLTQGSGGNVTIANGKSAIVFADGGGAGAAVTDLTATFVPAGALLAANNLSDVANAGTSRTNLGVAIGTDVLAFDTNLQAFVTAFTLPTTDGTSGEALVTDGSGTISFGSAGISTGKAIAMAIVFGSRCRSNPRQPARRFRPSRIRRSLMSAPNIVNVTTITGKSAVVDLTTTSATAVVSNAAASGKVFKINSLVVSNVDGTNAADITVSYYSEDDIGGTATEIVSTISVPADASLVVIDKNTSIYLEEDRSIGAIAGAANDLKVVVSYEEIS